eukprot:sb/3473897/
MCYTDSVIGAEHAKAWRFVSRRETDHSFANWSQADIQTDISNYLPLYSAVSLSFLLQGHVIRCGTSRHENNANVYVSPIALSLLLLAKLGRSYRSQIMGYVFSLSFSLSHAHSLSLYLTLSDIAVSFCLFAASLSHCLSLTLSRL